MMGGVVSPRHFCIIFRAGRMACGEGRCGRFLCGLYNGSDILTLFFVTEIWGGAGVYVLWWTQLEE